MFEKKREIEMQNRGGFPIKNALYAVFILLLIYVMYLYNGSKNQLNEVEMQVERYRREASDRISEIQDLVKSKDQLQETYQQEKHEGNNRFNSIKQQHSMLQSQFKETEADFLKLKNDMESMKAEHEATETQHATEFQQLKQQKDMEISDLKDQLANTNHQNEELTESIKMLQSQVQKLQIEKTAASNSNSNLLEQLQAAQLREAQLKQAQQNQAQLNQAQLNPALLNNNNNNIGNSLKIVNDAAASSNQNSQYVPAQGADNGLVNMKIPMGNNILQNELKDTNSLLEKKDPKKIAQENDELNAAHQVKPPSNNDEDLDKEDKDNVDPDEDGDVKDEPNVKPNDEKMAVIQEPNFGGDQQEDGGEAGVKSVNVGDVEDERANNAEKEENEGGVLNRPANPLALGQMGDSQGLGQQGAPLINDKDDNVFNNNNNKDPLFVESEKLSHRRHNNFIQNEDYGENAGDEDENNKDNENKKDYDNEESDNDNDKPDNDTDNEQDEQYAADNEEML